MGPDAVLDPVQVGARPPRGIGLVAAALFPLAGMASCGGGSDHGWWKAGYTDEAFIADADECADFAAEVAARFRARDLRDVRRKVELKSRLYVTCMRSRGYRWVEIRDGEPVDLGTGTGPNVNL